MKGNTSRRGARSKMFPICNSHPILLTAWLAVALVASAGAEDAAKTRRSELLKQMRELAKATEVRSADSVKPAQLVEDPVFRYDDQPRRFIDATLWAWTVQGRPVAFQKIEAVEYGDAKAPSLLWQFCFASMSRDRLSVEWPNGRRYASREAGLETKLLPGAPVPAEGNIQRKRQAREMVRKFAGRVVTDPKTNTREQMRLLTTPLVEFTDPRSMEYLGAVFGYSTNGTNPDVLLLLEIRSEGEGGAPIWHYAPVRMTCCEATLAYDDTEVWKVEWVNGTEAPFPTWTFFNTDRAPLVQQEEQP